MKREHQKLSSAQWRQKEMEEVVNGVDEVHTQARRRSTPKKRGTTIPESAQVPREESSAAERGRAEEAEDAEARQRLNTYSPTGATGVRTTGDDGEGVNS